MTQNLFFDLDGTIINSAQGIMNTLRKIYQQENLTVPLDNVLRKFIGPPLTESFEKYSQIKAQSPLAHKLIKDFQVEYGRQGWQEMELYPQVVPMLQQLQERGKNLYIATAKPESFAHQIIDYLELNVYFTGVYGSDLSETMHKADVIAHAMQAEKLTDPQDILMVGDRDTDVLGARENQIATIGVLYGFGSAEELTNAGVVSLAQTPLDVVEQVK
ncbi:HAD hydrolase-like protein [Lactobacillus sp. DCY120]|uniref:HAD hydrolase-like protein n=1 Tax=Bombilactobacillus apium TaxID=2675299 RepID=A0A850R7C8_9LACO|nr:HAD hydrolase-like protein [Bombilactobacillus apium]NVY96435.1 HAD hydrolase-like protein [Bombilactobacillus apium]